MVRQAKKEVLAQLFQHYRACAQDNDAALYEIAMSELPEMVYHSNAIENSTLTLHDTEAIIMRDIITKDHEIREVFEAKNLAYVMTQLLNKPPEKLTTELLLSLHALLMAGIRHDIAGRFRSGKQWVRVGSHVGANPAFVPGLIAELLREYDQCDDEYFLDAIARFHAEFELIHPFLDGNGRIGRVIINQQLMQKGYPPILSKVSINFAIIIQFLMCMSERIAVTDLPIFSHFFCRSPFISGLRCCRRGVLSR